MHSMLGGIEQGKFIPSGVESTSALQLSISLHIFHSLQRVCELS